MNFNGLDGELCIRYRSGFILFQYNYSRQIYKMLENNLFFCGLKSIEQDSIYILVFELFFVQVEVFLFKEW